MKKRVLTLLGILYLLFIQIDFSPVVSAAGNFSYYFSKAPSAGESTKLYLSLPEDFPPLAGFRCGITYNDDQLQCTDVNGVAPLSASSLYTSLRDSEVTCVYAAEGGNAISFSGAVISFSLKIKDIPSAEDSTITIWMDQLCDENGKPPEGIPDHFSQTVSFTEEDLSGPKLTVLAPDSGDLSPAFSPEIFSYSVSVSPAVKDIYFETAAEKNNHVSISRHKLQAAGENTVVLITVTDNSGRKTVYTVTVYRESESTSKSESKVGSKIENRVESKPESKTKNKSKSKNQNSTFSSSGNIEKVFTSEEAEASVSSSSADKAPLILQQSHGLQWTELFTVIFSAVALILVLLLLYRQSKKRPPP